MRLTIARNYSELSDMADIAKNRAKLIDQIAEAKAQIAQTEADRQPVELDQQMVGRLSRMDAIQQQALAKGTTNRRHMVIQRAELALKRIDDGEFGFCTDCGDEVEEARLTIDPSVALCLDCMRG